LAGLSLDSYTTRPQADHGVAQWREKEAISCFFQHLKTQLPVYQVQNCTSHNHPSNLGLNDSTVFKKMLALCGRRKREDYCSQKAPPIVATDFGVAGVLRLLAG
jgi:hypothetical protein